jgi:putative effector of murein hydrolase
VAGAIIYLPDEIQRSLAVRSVTTPFALAAAKPLGGQPDLVALFVVVTGVFGMAVGDVLFLRLSIREGMAKGPGLARHRTAPVPHDPMSLALRRAWSPAW